MKHCSSCGKTCRIPYGFRPLSQSFPFRGSHQVPVIWKAGPTEAVRSVFLLIFLYFNEFRSILSILSFVVKIGQHKKKVF